MRRIALVALLLSALARAQDTGTVSTLEIAVEQYVRTAQPDPILRRKPLLALAPGGTDQWEFGVGADLWYPRLKGDMGGPGQPSIPFETLAVGGHEWVFVPQFYATKEKWIFGFGLLSGRWDGATTLGSNVTFLGNTFTAGTPVTSSFQMDVFWLFAGYSVYRDEHVDVSAFFELDWWSFTGSIADATPALSRSEEKELVPGLGIAATGKWRDFFAVVAASGYWIEHGSVESSGWRLDATVGWSFAKMWSVYAGYRVVDVETKGGDLDAAPRMDGWMIGFVGVF